MSLFRLQYGGKPRLSTAQAQGPVTRLERAISGNNQKRIQNLRKYRTVAAEKYNAAMRRLAELGDDTAFMTDPFQLSDLLIHSPINRQSSLQQISKRR